MPLKHPVTFILLGYVTFGNVKLQRNFVPDRNPGDRYLKFGFTLPELYQNATVGPDVWGWLADRYGAEHLLQGGVRRAPSNSHICAEGKGWCRDRCRQTEKIAWKFKDLCGAYYCCVLDRN